MESPTEPSLAKGIRDIIVIGGILGGVNAAVSQGDFGWLQMNPTPWLILPALIGARYGVFMGVASGIAAGLGISMVHAREHGLMVQTLSQQHPFFFSALIVAGFVAGEFQRYTKGRSRELLETTHGQAEALYRVRAELDKEMAKFE